MFKSHSAILSVLAVGIISMSAAPQRPECDRQALFFVQETLFHSTLERLLCRLFHNPNWISADSRICYIWFQILAACAWFWWQPEWDLWVTNEGSCACECEILATSTCICPSKFLIQLSIKQNQENEPHLWKHENTTLLLCLLIRHMLLWMNSIL